MLAYNPKSMRLVFYALLLGIVLSLFSIGAHGKPVMLSIDSRHDISTTADYKEMWRGFSVGYGPRPAKWCGWILRQWVSRDPGEKYNRAYFWSTWGRKAVPAPGVIVVWPHHVGKIVEVTGKGRAIVKSGNDGGQIRTRERSIANAIAFRSE